MKINTSQVEEYQIFLSETYTPLKYDYSKEIIFDIIHVYPEESCIGDDGSLNGFRDSMFFTVKLFNTSEKTVVSPTKHYDGIEISTQTKFETRVFCDGSYLMKFWKLMKFDGLFQYASITDI